MAINESKQNNFFMVCMRFYGCCKDENTCGVGQLFIASRFYNRKRLAACGGKNKSAENQPFVCWKNGSVLHNHTIFLEPVNALFLF
jgi:hypothetical protein